MQPQTGGHSRVVVLELTPALQVLASPGVVGQEKQLAEDGQAEAGRHTQSAVRVSPSLLPHTHA